MTQDTGGTGYDAAGLNVHLTGERSHNGAQALQGYPLDVRPDGSWPGLDTSSGKLRYQPEELKRISEWLIAQKGQTQSLPQWLSSATQVSFGPATWHEATNLKKASDLLSAAVAEHVGNVVANLAEASASIKSVHATHTTTEQATNATVNSVNHF
jgi:hypothetical protein